MLYNSAQLLLHRPLAIHALSIKQLNDKHVQACLTATLNITNILAKLSNLGAYSNLPPFIAFGIYNSGSFITLMKRLRLWPTLDDLCWIEETYIAALEAVTGKEFSTLLAECLLNVLVKTN